MIFALPQYGSLRIEGPDAKKFLQGQLTCNLEQLKPHQIILGAHCNPKGRIISLFYCIYHDDSYTLIMPREMVPIAESALKKYAVFFKVACINRSDEDQLSVKTSDEKILMTPELVFSIESKSSDKKHITPTTAWEQRCMKEKIPVILPITSQTFLPHELNLEALDAISFDKGCYTGQEIIARMHYRSEVKYQLQQANLHSELPLTPGLDVFQVINESPKIIGRIVNLVETSPNEYQLLISVRAPYTLIQPFFINKA